MLFFFFFLIIFSTDYFTELITTSMTSIGYVYENISGLCGDERGDTAYRLESAPHGVDLSHFFDIPNPSLNIRNRFDELPFCIAFLVSDVTSESTLVYAGNNPMITLGSDITFTLGGRSATFTSQNLLLDTDFARLQICIDENSAVLYNDCEQVETAQFSGSSLTAVSFLSVLGESFVLNDTSIFSVSC